MSIASGQKKTCANEAETLDTIYNGKIKLFQKKNGYRFSIDAVLLADFLLNVKGGNIIDIGTGCGVVPLMIVSRKKHCKITGIEIQEQVGRAAEHLHGAAEAIHALTRAGRRTADVSVRYQTALTAYMQVSQTQHSLDLETLDDQTRQVASISTDIRGSAEVAAEHQWEHKLLLILIWFLALSATVLAWFKLRGLEKGGQ